MYNVFMKKLLLCLIILFVGQLNSALAVNPSQLKDDALMLYSVNKIKESKALLEEIPEEYKDAETYLLLSNISQDLQETENIEKYLKLSIEKDPKFYKAYYNLGNLYFNSGNIDEALKYYKTALKYNNKNSYIYTNIGCCYLAKKNSFLAKTNFNRAATLNPQNPTNYYNLAYIYKESGNNKKAEELLKIYNKLMLEKIN